MSPPLERLILGDVREALPAARSRFVDRAALAHFDLGTGAAAATQALSCALAPLIAPLMSDGAVIVSGAPLPVPGWHSLRLPDGIEPGRYHLYRAVE